MTVTVRFPPRESEKAVRGRVTVQCSECGKYVPPHLPYVLVFNPATRPSADRRYHEECASKEHM